MKMKIATLSLVLMVGSCASKELNRNRHTSFDADFGTPETEGKDVGCGNHILDPSMTLRIQSPYFQYDYQPNYYECTWTFFGTSECNPLITCDSFNLAQSANCSDNFLELSDGSDSKTKFCGIDGPQEVASRSSMLISHYKTTSSSYDDNGFRCTVSCAPPPQLKFPINLLPTSPPKVADCLCGVPGGADVPSRIVNGTIAEKYKWKWQASLVLRSKDTPMCGGSLINDKYVLTAAHCVVTTGLAVFPAAAEVVLNDYNIETTNETVTIRRSIISAIPHPQYNPATQDYDIAILELSQPVDLTATEEPRVTPVCLPPKGERSLYVDEIGTVTGWGTTTENGDQSDFLMQVDVPVVSNEECNKHYDNRITPRMICAGYPEGQKDSCQGDSGGPFVRQRPDGRYEEIGVVSFGQGCARPGKEGVYARVTELNDWIRSTAKSATWCKE